MTEHAETEGLISNRIEIKVLRLTYSEVIYY